MAFYDEYGYNNPYISWYYFNFLNINKGLVPLPRLVARQWIDSITGLIQAAILHAVVKVGKSIS